MKDETGIGSGSDYIAMKMDVKMTAGRAAEVAVSWLHLMTAQMTDPLTVRVVLRRVGSTSG